jgi:hypothetical protein
VFVRDTQPTQDINRTLSLIDFLPVVFLQGNSQ